jgi:hypothetical protein
MKIGLVGFKQVGKSTAAEHLRKTYGFERINFKYGMIAKMLEDFPDFIPAYCEEREKHYWDVKPWTFGRLNQEKPKTWRAFMINYGTDLWRTIENNIWVRKWGEKAQEYNNVVADDVRFLNEAEMVKDEGGILIRLNRPDVTTGGDHRSETEQLAIKCDYTIEFGSGDFETLYAELDHFIGNFHKSPHQQHVI